MFLDKHYLYKDISLDSDDRLLLIAGPCSAESREQLLMVAEALSDIPQMAFFRAGIWKPRTRPDGFEGVGEQGLSWLLEAKRMYGLKTCVEVAQPQHVEMCLKYEVDAFWIGARTTGNPFSVQALAEAVKGTNRPVMIKNPMNPDLKLWIGALERFHDAGTEKLAAIHRGFHQLHQGDYRNAPMWELPIELKRRMPSLPMICDPSHIGGKPALLKPVAQMAINLGFEGLMIEVHPSPKEAKTDAKQQITPQELLILLDELVMISHQDGLSGNAGLEQLRHTIDSLDSQMIHLLSKRMELSKEISRYKKEHKMTIFQVKRWEEVLNNCIAQAKTLYLDESFVKKIMEQIHMESIRIQNELLNNDQ